jgi:phage terminase large subunit-like protein
VVGEREWLSLYQQRPTADQGTYFRREWFANTYSEKPPHLNVYITGDFAVTPGDGDFTELGVWGVAGDGQVYALDWWHGQTTADIWVTALLALIQRWRPLFFAGETGPIRRAVEPLMSRMMQEQRIYCAMEWLSHSGGNKEALCRSFQAMAAQGRIRFPKDSRWAERVVDQLLRFPSAKHDAVCLAASSTKCPARRVASRSINPWEWSSGKEAGRRPVPSDSCDADRECHCARRRAGDRPREGDELLSRGYLARPSQY